MTLVSPTVPNPGDEANASDISTPINQLAAVINGGIDDTNISSLSGSKIAAGTVAVSQLGTDAVETAKIKDSNVTASKLSTSAITLGYSQITANVALSSPSASLITGLSASVTIPAGGRKVKITAYFGNVGASAGSVTYTFGLWDGTVGSGTNIANTSVGIPAGFAGSAGVVMAVVTPSAGAKTYNASLGVPSGTGTIQASATSPAFILVEAI